MQFLGTPFCAVCREQFVNAIHGLISSIDSYSPQTLDRVDENIFFDISLVAPVPNTLKTTWFLNGHHLASDVLSVEILSSQWNDGTNILRADVYDSTTYDRRTTMYVNTVEWEINSSVTSMWSKTAEERAEYLGGKVLSVERANTERLSWSVYPNPTPDRLKIDFELYHMGNTQLLIHNEAGQLIAQTSARRQAGKYHDEIDLSGYDAGVYFLTFEAGGYKQTVKVIKGD